MWREPAKIVAKVPQAPMPPCRSGRSAWRSTGGTESATSSSGVVSMNHPQPGVRAVRPQEEVLTRQQLPYFLGISGRTVGASGLSMHLVVIPPGGRAQPHVHVGYETGIYVLEGTVCTR